MCQEGKLAETTAPPVGQQLGKQQRSDWLSRVDFATRLAVAARALCSDPYKP